MDVTQAEINVAKSEFIANGGVIQQLSPTNRISKIRKPCAWCGSPIQPTKRPYKLCKSCGKCYNRKISTKQMQRLQLADFKQYQRRKAIIFKEGCKG